MVKRGGVNEGVNEEGLLNGKWKVESDILYFVIQSAATKTGAKNLLHSLVLSLKNFFNTNLIKILRT